MTPTNKFPKRVLVITSDVPFVEGGHRVIARSLCKAVQDAGHQCEIITTPQNRFGHQFSAYLATYLTDVTVSGDGLPVDHVISLRFPSYAVRHGRHSCWLNHRMREYYDLWERFSKTLSLRNRLKESLRRQLIFRLDRRLLTPKRVRLFAQSVNIQERLLRFGNRKSELLYPPPPQRNYRCGEYPPVILCVGRLHAMKRVDLLIRSFSQLDDSWRLVVVGRGPEAGNLRQLADQLGSGKRISWMEGVDDDELCELYSNCRLVFYGPIDEDYGMVPLEAFSSGKPVITCEDSGGAKEWVEDGVCGRISPADPTQIASAMAEFTDEAISRKMGNAGREKILRLGWEHVVKELLWENP